MPDSPLPLVPISGGLLLGGSTTFLLNLHQGFRKLGFPLPMLSMSQANEHAADFSRLAVDLRVVPNRPLIYEDRLLWAYGELAQLKPRAILSCLGADSFEPLRCVPSGVVRMGVVQSHEPGTYRNARQYGPWLDAIIGVSEEVCAELRAFPEFASVRVEHVPYGIAFGPMTPRPERPRDAPLRVLYLGRIIEEQKRVSRLAELVRLARETRLPVSFTIVGSGRDELRLRESLAGCSEVAFLGAVPNDRVRSVLQEHDVFILLSDYEGLPLSLLEAMGEGVVPVVSDLPSGVRQAVRDGCGVRVAIGDVAAALAALRTLAEDRSRLDRLGAAAAAHVRAQFGAEEMARRYLTLAECTASSVAPRWPDTVGIPEPLGMRRGWLFRGWPRRLRRQLKKVWPRGSSSQ